MSRRKSAKNVPIPGWLSANLDCKEGRFIQVGNSLLLSEDFQALKPTTQNLYLCLAMESGGRPVVKLSHSAALRKYGMPHTTYDRAVKELVAKGFIERVNDEEYSQFRTNEFRFSTVWKQKPVDNKHDLGRNKGN